MTRTLNDLADLLYSDRRAETDENPDSGHTSTVYGTAMSDSANGLVVVKLSDDATQAGGYEGIDETGVELPTVVNVHDGDEVIVTLVGGKLKTPFVSGVVGIGDETNSRITAIETDYVKATMLEADLAEIGVLTADSAVISEIQAETAKVENVTAAQLEASTAYIGALQTGNVTAQNIIADKAKLAQIDTSQITADHAVINTLDSNYAKIDLANVSNAWIDDGVIRDAAIGDAQIADISANKLTAGTINGSVINVTNLNATNITTGTINGQRLGEGSISLSKLSESVYTEGEVDSIVSNLNDRIDSAIETYTATAVPTLSNYPASSWDTNDERAEHVGDICYVLNAGSETDGYTYRFAYDNSTGTYQWVLIKDNQVTAALQRLVDAEGDIDGLQSFQSDTSVWISDTDEALNVIRTNHTSLTTVVNKTIVETVQLWYSKANTTAPAKPTSQVTSTSTSGGAWRTVVPSYSTSYPNYFYCYQWKYADGTYGWSSVTRDIAMGEAQSTSRTAASNASTAITNASAAQTTADGAATAASNAQATANSNIKSSVQLWYSKDNETAPSKPTAQVTSTSTSGNGWRTVVPTYSSSYPYYYYCYQYQMGDGTYKWSDVVYDRATTESQSTARATASSLSNYITTNNGALAALKSQVDGQLEVWYGSADPTASNPPASGWDSDQKTAHSGDLYYNVSDGTVWQWSGSSWTELPDDAAAAALNAAQDAQATADGKRRIFTTTPTVPYDIGDLWVTGNEVRYATVKKSSSQSYSASDWSQTATDDTAANAAQATADKNVKTSIQLWYTKDNETPPAKPTAKVTSNSTSGGGWRIVVPSYNASYPKYFYCYQYELADGTYTWSDVVFDRATTENEANAHSALTQLTTKVDTQTFNDLTDTVSEHTRKITNLTTITTSNGLTADTNITNTVNTVSQTATSNSSKLTQLTTTLGTNADGTSKAGDIVHRTSAVEQDLSGFKSTVSETYATKNELSAETTARTTAIQQTTEAIALKANSSDVYTKSATDGLISTEVTNRNAAIQTATDGIRSEVSETYATKTEVRRTDTGSGTVITSDDAANLPPLSLTIHGKSVQDGTPSPSSPVEIQSVEGRNLLPSNYKSGSQTYQGLTWTINSDGTLTCSGTATANGYYVLYGGFANAAPVPSWMVAGRTYGFGDGYTDISSDHGMMMVYFYSGTGTLLAANQRTSNNFTVPSGATSFGVFIRFENGKALNTTFYPRITARTYAMYTPYGSIGIGTERGLIDFSTGATVTSGTEVVDDNGAVTVSAPSASGWFYAYWNTATEEGARYILSATTSGTSPRIMLAFNDEPNATSFIRTIQLDGAGDRSVTTVSPSGANYVQAFLYARNSGSGTASDASTYEYPRLVKDGMLPYIPLQGHALRSLPDGTEDTLEVDGEGNVTLTKRAGEVTFDGSEGFTWTALTTASSSLKAFLIRATSGSAKNWSSVFGESTLPIQSTAVADHVNVLTNRLQPSAQHYNAWTSPQVIMWGDASAAIIIAIDESITTSAQVNTWLASNPLTVVYKLNTPQTISLGKIDLPALPSPSFSMHVDASVTPTLDAEWWTQGGEEVGSVYQRTSALEQDAEGFSVRMRGLETDSVRKSKDEWTAWLDVGTDSDNNPFLAMGQSGNDLNSRLSNESMGFYNGTEELMKLSGADGVKADTVRSKRVYIGSWILEELDSGDMAIKLVGGE